MDEAQRRLERSKRNHRIALAAMVTLVAIFFIATVIISVPKVVQTVLICAIGLAALAIAVTTMSVMINRSPSANPED